MKKTRHGKIARLPYVVREELNRRMRNGEEGKMLVVWLNSLPEVRAVVVEKFGGVAVREQNLSEWKKGGYRDWLEQEATMELAERLGSEATAVAEDQGKPMTEILARWVVARYAVATRQIVAATGEERWRMLREMCADFVKLREGNHRAERLELARRRVGLPVVRLPRRRKAKGNDPVNSADAQVGLSAEVERAREGASPRTPPPCEAKLRSQEHSEVQLRNEEKVCLRGQTRESSRATGKEDAACPQTPPPCEAQLRSSGRSEVQLRNEGKGETTSEEPRAGVCASRERAGDGGRTADGADGRRFPGRGDLVQRAEGLRPRVESGGEPPRYKTQAPFGAGDDGVDVSSVSDESLRLMMRALLSTG